MTMLSENTYGHDTLRASNTSLRVSLGETMVDNDRSRR